MSKIRVMLLMHELTLTGAPRVVLDFFGALTDVIDLHILAPTGGPIEPQVRALGTLTLLEKKLRPDTLSGRVDRRLFLPQLERSLARWKPDIIYVNSIASLYMLNLIRLPQVPVLLHVHELDAIIKHFTRGLESLFLERPARYIAISEAVKHTLVTECGINADKISIIYECIAEDLAKQYQAVPPKKEDTRFVVGGAGTPEPRKGFTLWLQMAAALIAKVGADKVRFVWVGFSDSYYSTLHRVIAKKMGLEPYIEFVPLTPSPWSYFNDFDVFTVTSWEEAFSIVMAETMFLGKPGLCFAECGGTSEVVGDTGIVISGFAPEAMADAIAELMHSPERRADLGRRSRQRVLENFMPSIQAPKIEREIRALVKNQN